jgi:hypothetical protein
MGWRKAMGISDLKALVDSLDRTAGQLVREAVELILK